MLIEGVNISPEVLTTKFACDYSVCKGKCCWGVCDVPLYGAEVTADEARELKEKQKQLIPYIPKHLRAAAYRKNVVHNNARISLCKASCIYCGDTCNLRQAHKDGVLSFDIPVWCELYPLDVQDNTLFIADYYGGEFCGCGYERGERENIYAIDFLKRGIVRLFGETFWLRLKEAQADVIGSINTTD